MITDQSAPELTGQPLSPDAEPVPSDIEAFRSKLTDLEQQARTFIQQRPVVAVLAAVGAGYFVARLLARAGR